jgi:nonsense-mediated mRNA decay protein 3
MCGTTIEPNAMNMCSTCIAAEVDIAEGIDLDAELLQCSGCLRFQSRPKGVGQSTQGAWVACDWESTELMALCLKHVHGLAKAKLMDANFIWTEQHSKRVKVKLTLQREVLNHAVVQNSCVVTYVIKNLQCPDCVKQFRNNHWRVLVQVRQKAEHKRTFFRLEQLLLKHKAHEDAIGISTAKDGVDFYFGTKSAGEKFLHFLSSRVPMRSKSASKMVSENVRQNTANMQTVFSVELCPISKDDLVLLPPKTAQSCSSLAPLALCARTTALVHFVDPRTGRRGELQADKFWKVPFLPLDTSPHMVEFIVLDVEPVHATHGHGQQQGQKSGGHVVVADIEVARASDFGVNDTTFVVRSHLGGLLEAGDSVKGYDLSSANFGTRFTYSLKDELPDVVLVRKIYPREQSSSKADRKDKKRLKKLTADERGAKLSKAEASRYEREFEQFEEEFLEEQELGEDEEDEEDQEEFVPVEDEGEEEPLASNDGDEEKHAEVAATLDALALAS